MHPEDFLSLEECHRLLKAAQSARLAEFLLLLGGAAYASLRCSLWTEWRDWECI